MPNSPTRAELNERIDYVVYLMSTGMKRGQVKRALQEKYKVKRPTCDRYITMANQIISAAHGTATSETIAQGVTYLQHKMRNAEKDADGIKAWAELAKLLGLNAPDKQERKVTSSSPVEDMRAELMRQAAERNRQPSGN